MNSRNRAHLPLASIMALSLRALVCASTSIAFAQGKDADRQVESTQDPLSRQAEQTGHQAVHAGDEAAALEHYTRAIELLGPNDPRAAELFLRRASTLKRLGRLQASLQDANKAISLAPNDRYAKFVRSGILLSLNRPGEALADIAAYARAAPKELNALQERSYQLYQLRRFQEAIAADNEALKIEPNNHYVLCDRGRSNKDAGYFDAALRTSPDALRSSRRRTSITFAAICILTMGNITKPLPIILERYSSIPT
jgi:tetratricopeptide (TPR) repeat protein